MLPSLVQKLSNSVSHFVNENLLSIKMLREMGVKEVLEIVSEKTNVMDFLKIKFLDSLKDSELTKMAIKHDNLIILQEIYKKDPYIVDSVYERFFEHDDVGMKAISINTLEDRENLLILMQEAKKNVHRVIKNPFTDHFINTALLAFNLNTEQGAAMIANPVKYEEAKNRNNHQLVLSNTSIIRLEIEGFKSIKGISSKQVAFDFMLYHELSHANYSQMSSASQGDFYKDNHHEKNSDVSSLVKMIKEYDLNQEEAQSLCDMCIMCRVNTSKDKEISRYASYTDCHYTEDAVFYLKKVIETDLEKVKSIPDKEIGRYVDFIIEAGNNTPGLGLDNNNMKSSAIEQEFLAALITRNNRNQPTNVKESVDHINSIYYQTYEDKFIYTEVIAAEKILADPVNGINKIHAAFDGSNIAPLANMQYEIYKINKKDFSEGLGPKIDSKTLQKKLNM
jgi:hypothetical protein